tara:strand:- start:690 stop:1643 length:954 start_codon:yes stop_codon:yes gene_type:complete
MDRLIESNNLKKKLKKYLNNKSKRTIIICPFITNSTLDEILENHNNGDVVIVTSWRIDHLKNGVSNIELYNLTVKRKWHLYINNLLHLKLYSNDLEDGWIGSANITSKALMDNKDSNIEGLMRIDRLKRNDRILIEGLFINSTFVTEKIYQKYKKYMEGIEISMPVISDSLMIDDLKNENDFLITKLPLIESPSRLYELFVNLVEPNDSAEYEDLIHDCGLYGISDYADKDDFINQLSMKFFEQPFILKFLSRISYEEMRFGAIKEWLQNECTTMPTPHRKELTYITQNLIKWITELNPDKYEIIRPKYSEIIRMKK